MTNNKFEKRGEVKFVSGEYERDGAIKKQYTSAGALFATPHFTRVAIKLYPTITSDSKWLNVFWDMGKEPDFKVSEDVIKDDPMSQIPF